MARRARSLPFPPIRPLECEFCIEGPAVSARSKNRTRLRAWTEAVAGTARAAWPAGRAPIEGDIDVAISEFSEFASHDRDNMAKPVLDAMQGIVYENDRQIRHLHVEWCEIDGAYVVRRMSPIVALALSTGREFLWVRVSVHEPRRTLLR